METVTKDTLAVKLLRGVERGPWEEIRRRRIFIP